MREKIVEVLKRFFVLNALMYVILYVVYLTATGYLGKVVGIAQVVLTINATIAAVLTGTLVALFLQKTVANKEVALRHTTIRRLKISGTATSFVVEISTILVLMKDEAALIGLALIKGAVYPAGALVDWYKFCRREVRNRRIPSLKRWLIDEGKAYEFVAMFTALLGVALIAYAKMPKSSGVWSWLLFAAAATGVVTYSVAYGIRQHFMALYNESVDEWLEAEILAKTQRGEFLSLESAKHWKLFEQLKTSIAYPTTEQIYCFVSFMVKLCLFLVVAYFLGFLSSFKLDIASAAAGMPYGALALFSVLIMMVPFKRGQDNASMLFRNLVHKAGGIAAGLVAMVWLGYFYGPELLAHKISVWPSSLELAGSMLVFVAMIVERPLRGIIRIFRSVFLPPKSPPLMNQAGNAS